MQNQFKSEENSFSDLSLEQYLKVLSAPLPLSEQEDWREEAGQHLHSLIAAHEELGLSHKEAILAALRSFGQADTIGQEVAREITRLSPREVGLLWWHGIYDFARPVVPMFVMLGAGTAVYAFVGGEVYMNVLANVASVLFYTCPVLSGWNFGRKTEGSVPVRDLLLLPLLATILCLPHAFIFSALQNHFSKPDPTLGLLWLPMALTATHLSWHWHHRKWRLQRAK